MTLSPSPGITAVARRDLLAAGLTDGAIRHRLATGQWQPLFPGTYAPFSGLIPRAVWLGAAVLYAGDGAVLSHGTAAAVQGWRRPDDQCIHVSLPAGRKVAGPAPMQIHRPRLLLPSDLAPGSGPLMTRVERTVIDLVAGSRSELEVVGVVTDALRSRLTTRGRLLAAVQARGRLHGRPLLLDLLAEHSAGVESPLEHSFGRCLCRHGLPQPRRQVRIVLPDGRIAYLDTLFDPYDVNAELDGVEGHSTPDERARDRRRDNAQSVAGRLPLRYGWTDLLGRSCAVAHEVGAALRLRGWPGTVRLCGSSCEPGLQQASA